MRGNTQVLILFITIILIVDVYSFQAVKLFFEDWSQSKKRIVYTFYWLLTAISIGIIFFTFFNGSPTALPNWFKAGVLSPAFIFFFSKIILVLFLFLDDGRRILTWVTDKLTSSREFDISRSKFITSAGVLLAGSLFGSLMYGIIKGAYNYTVHKKKIGLKNLPSAFEGFKIVQISDLHVGSFVSERPLDKAVGIINDLNADIVLFTGDLVNNKAEELTPFESTLKKIKSKHGVYSILGNHDYGDYVLWENEDAKRNNLNTLFSKQKDFGWRLLLDEFIEIEKEGDTINLVGIQNWGAKARFPKYGNLKKATNGINKQKPTILMSHDPSHWEAQVLQEYDFIDLTLSGHTHGMQFGVEIPDWVKWSPVKYIYKQWAGLYKKNDQQLYVNRGLGFIGYPGRVGISPEITVLELSAS